jgi:hypothetical protein
VAIALVADDECDGAHTFDGVAFVAESEARVMRFSAASCLGNRLDLHGRGIDR